jgi:phage-related protein
LRCGYAQERRWLGDSREDVRRFPADVRNALGEELLAVQLGAPPNDFKPMPTIGKGVYEIRVRLEGAWRLIYVTKFESAIYVLHVFQKTTQRTAKADIEVAKKRYRSMGETR